MLLIIIIIILLLLDSTWNIKEKVGGDDIIVEYSSNFHKIKLPDMIKINNGTYVYDNRSNLIIQQRAVGELMWRGYSDLSWKSLAIMPPGSLGD